MKKHGKKLIENGIAALSIMCLAILIKGLCAATIITKVATIAVICIAFIFAFRMIRHIIILHKSGYGWTSLSDLPDDNENDCE